MVSSEIFIFEVACIVAYSERRELILSFLPVRELTNFSVRGPEHGLEAQSRFGLSTLQSIVSHQIFYLSLHIGL
jgi:hypothetical protein